MKDNDKCIILKRKEYNELLEKSNNPPEIIIKHDKIDIYQRSYITRKSIQIYYEIEGTIDLSNKLHDQITSIIKNVDKKCEKLVDKYADVIIIDAYTELAKMSYRERRKFLKQYK